MHASPLQWPAPGPPPTRMYQRAITIPVITVCLIMCPEVVLTWALREYINARRLAQIHSIPSAHAFLLMGGFTTSTHRPIVYDKEAAIAIVRTEIQGVKLSEIKQIDKATIIAKAVAVLQSGWLVTQALARAANNLPLSLFELSFLAFTLNSLFLSFLWYNKPLNITNGKTLTIQDHYLEAASPARIIYDNSQFPRLRAFLSGSNLFQAISRGAHPQGPQQWKYDKSHDDYFLILTALFATIFGVIHVGAWGNSFASETEKTLWRGCSLAIVGLPSVILSTLIASQPSRTRKDIKQFKTVLSIAVGSYVMARAVLIILPPGAASPSGFGGSWTTKIPHFH